MPAKKEICFPVFLECCEYAPDTFWENIFSELAYGKAPFGSYISKGFLCCNYKKKEFSYKIEKKDPKVLYTDVYNLLTKKLGLLSNSDKIKKKKDFTEHENNIKNSRQTWSSIRKKNVRELLLELYVVKKKQDFSLTLTQARNLVSLIYIAMVFKVITSNDIVYENGEITEIKGIDFTKGKIFLEKDLYSGESTVSSSILAPSKKLLSDSWNKYVKELNTCD